MSLSHGAIILCGGASTRMGRDKVLLPFGPSEVLLQRVVRLVGAVVPHDRIVCVAAVGQSLPPLSADVVIIRDEHPAWGPLAGLATGLAAIAPLAEAVFVCGCDAPLLVPAFITRMFELLAKHQIAAPHDGQRLHPLAAVYRSDVLDVTRSLLATGDRSLQALLRQCDTRQVPIDELRDVDPQFNSLENCNTTEEYERLAAQAFSVRVDA
jgi:molybdopterin-guanine dinucleotide biosynthesis protein A